MPTRAVLFDFDGVIADTENVHVAAWQRTFAALGWEESDEACARAAQLDDRAFLAEVFARRNVRSGDLEGWSIRKQALARELLVDAPRIFPGVPALVRAIAGEARLAIVSTAPREAIEAVLGASGLADAFDVIVAREGVKAPKPDPEAYRSALARLEVGPDEAVALEDSPTGLASARGSGVRTIAVGHGKPAGDWSEGVAFLPDLLDLDACLAALGFAGGELR